MKHYRVEIGYTIPRGQLAADPNPERFIPRSVTLIDEDGNRVELFGVRQASMSWGLHDTRILNVSLIVRGVDEVFEGEQVVEGDVSDGAQFIARTEVEVDLPGEAR